jgi:hypothetical protein
VQAALEALTIVGTGNVTVTGSAGGPWTIVLPQILGTPVLQANGAALTGGTPVVTVVNSPAYISWDLLSGLANPITTSVTKLFVTSGANATNFTVVSAVQPTPGGP